MYWLSMPALFGLIAPWPPCPPMPITPSPNSTMAWPIRPFSSSTREVCDLAEAERALEERERRADVLIRNLRNDRGLPPRRDLVLDCRHEHCLSPVERRWIERGVAPQLLHEIHRLHRDLTLLFPLRSSSSRRCARARLSRERTVPIGSSSASATLW